MTLGHFPGADSQVLIWDLATGTMVAQLAGHTNTVYDLCFSRDGTMLASGQCECVPLVLKPDLIKTHFDKTSLGYLMKQKFLM